MAGIATGVAALLLLSFPATHQDWLIFSMIWGVFSLAPANEQGRWGNFFRGWYLAYLWGAGSVFLLRGVGVPIGGGPGGIVTTLF